MTSPARSRTAAAADDWLSSQDDVLGPDDGAPLPIVPPSYCTSSDVMEWSAERSMAAPVGATLADVLREGAMDTIARYMAAVRPAAEAAGRALGRFAAAVGATQPPPPPSRLERSRQQRVATDLRRRDRRAARHRRSA